MKICILEDRYVDSASPIKDVDPPADPTVFLEGHDVERYCLRRTDAVSTVISLARRNYDVFLNLCDGAWDEDRPGIEVVQTLERLGVAFTGADSRFYEPSRQRMALVCHYLGIDTPRSVFAERVEDVGIAAEVLRFPMIVKHPSSYSSIGLTPDSRVENIADLRTQLAKMIDAFGSALIEEFIDGREFTVLVAENPDDPTQPIAFAPIEFIFPPGESFKHFDMKWKNYHDMSDAVVRDPVLAGRLKSMSSSMFVGLNGTGYGRCDIRMNDGGELFMLEINPNCGIFYIAEEAGSADLILLQEPDGYKRFVDAILRSAFRRVQTRQRKWERRLTHDNTFGMFASQPIVEGEMIEQFEAGPHHLVSREHVRKNWDRRGRNWFAQYAWPLTDEIYVIWNPDPEQWKPINHSCDPNVWLEQLNLIARRPIATGEQITVDYATFCNEMMAAFDCSCGARNCRGTIKGTDYLQPFVERYGNHCSDYVRRKRQQLATVASP